MKYIITLIVALCALVSCDGFYDNRGYPSKVKFARSGGVQVVGGQTYFIGLHIENGDDIEYSIEVENDTIEVTSHWLTAKTKLGDPTLILIAKPDTGEKAPKKLTVGGSFGDKLAIIEVERK